MFSENYQTPELPKFVNPTKTSTSKLFVNPVICKIDNLSHKKKKKSFKIYSEAKNPFRYTSFKIRFFQPTCFYLCNGF